MAEQGVNLLLSLLSKEVEDNFKKKMTSAEDAFNNLSNLFGGDEANRPTEVGQGETQRQLAQQTEAVTKGLNSVQGILQDASNMLKQDMVNQIKPHIDPNPILNQAKQQEAIAALRTEVQPGTTFGPPQPAQSEGRFDIIDRLSETIQQVQTGKTGLRGAEADDTVTRLLNELGQVIAPGSSESGFGDTISRMILGKHAGTVLGPQAKSVATEFLGQGATQEQTARIGNRHRAITSAEVSQMNQNQRLQANVMALGEELGIKGTPEQIAQQLTPTQWQGVVERTQAPLDKLTAVNSKEFQKLSLETRNAGITVLKSLQDVQKGNVDLAKSKAEFTNFAKNAELDIKKKDADLRNIESQIVDRKEGATAKQRELEIQKARAELAEMRAGVFPVLGAAIENGLVEKEELPALLGALLSGLAPELGTSVETLDGFLAQFKSFFGGTDKTIRFNPTPKEQQDESSKIDNTPTSEKKQSIINEFN